VQGIPAQEKDLEGNHLYPQSLIRAEILKLVIKHGGRILNPKTDLIFSESSDRVIVILDGFEPLSLVKEDQQDAQSSEEEEAEDASKEEKKVDKKPEPVEEMPTIYNCPACTFENSVSVSNCEI
jgi:hypothetical protein